MTATKPRPAESGTTLTPESFARLTAVLYLERRKPGFSRSVRPSDVVAREDAVDRKMLTVQKHLLDRKVMREINSEDNAIVGYLQTRAAICSMLARGMWAIPVGLVDEVGSVLDGYKARRAALVRVLCREKYVEAKDAAKISLADHYREADYPSVAELEAAFGVTTRWLSFNVPSALEQASAEIYQRESARLRSELVDASAEIRTVAREAFAGLVEHLSDVLGSDKDGKPNRFQDSTVTKMQDFLAVFAARDLTGDEEVGELVAKASAVLAGMPAERVRSELNTRNRVLGAMKEIKTTLRQLDVLPPRARRFRTEGEV